MTEAAEKLAHLLPHWVEHNEAHLEGFEKWARTARETGLDDVARALDEAVSHARAVTGALRRGAQALPVPG